MAEKDKETKIKYIRVLSDIHLEFGWYEIQPMDTDNETILILAGDIGILSRPNTYKQFIIAACEQFPKVIWVFGNHEYYHGSIIDSNVSINVLESCPNLYVGDCFDLETDDFVFICATLWTDFNHEDPLAMLSCQKAMNDFHIIQTGAINSSVRHKFNPSDALIVHKKHKRFISDQLDKVTDKVKIVVTHHAPSYKSVSPKYQGDIINSAYVNDMDSFVMGSDAKFWIHGHTHDVWDYDIGGTRVICNTVGYTTDRTLNHLPKARYSLYD